MLKKIADTLNIMIPFLQQCPKWLQILVTIGIVYIIIVLLIVLVWFLLFRAPQKEIQPKNTLPPTSTSNIKPIFETMVDIEKNLIIQNKGPMKIKDISIFATRYVLDLNPYVKEVKIEEYNKIGGAIYTIPMLEAKTGKEVFDLTKNSTINIYDSPIVEGNGIPFTTFYCFRITYRDADTEEKYINYRVTSSYKNFPSLIENQERTATAGTPEGDFMYEIPKVIEEHQKIIFGE